MAKFVGYWEDLTEMPADGPFVLCGGPMKAGYARVEQARGPSGIGSPIVLHNKLRNFLKENNLPMRGRSCADTLNDMYQMGELRWDAYDHNALVPKGTENLKECRLL